MRPGSCPSRWTRCRWRSAKGPCLDAVHEHRPYEFPTWRESRWPRFSPRALELGAASMLSFQLYVEGDNLGALNLYSRHANSFDDDSEHIGLLFATHAAVALPAPRRSATSTSLCPGATSSGRRRAFSWSGSRPTPTRPSACWSGPVSSRATASSMTPRKSSRRLARSGGRCRDCTQVWSLSPVPESVGVARRRLRTHLSIVPDPDAEDVVLAASVSSGRIGWPWSRSSSAADVVVDRVDVELDVGEGALGLRCVPTAFANRGKAATVCRPVWRQRRGPIL